MSLPNKLERYMLREIAGPFGLALALFLAVVTFGELLRVSDDLRGLQLSPADFGAAVMYSLPPLMGILIPMCALFASLVGYSRLAADGEWVAMSAAGVSPWRALGVLGAASALLALVSTVLLTWGEPWGIRNVQAIVTRGAQNSLTDVSPGQFYEWPGGLSFFARGRRGETLEGVVLADSQDPAQPVVFSAAEAQIMPGLAPEHLVLELREGSALWGHGDGTDYRRIRFAQARYLIDVGALVGGRLFNVTKAQAMTPTELLAAAQVETRVRRRALYTVTLHRRFALPSSTIIFALLAVPLASRTKSGARARSFLWGAAIVVAYYYVGRAAELSARAGAMPAELAAWLPNMLGLLALGVALGTRGWGGR